MAPLRAAARWSGGVLLAAGLVACGATRSAGGLFDDLVRAADDVVRTGDELADGSVVLPELPAPVPAGRVPALVDDVDAVAADMVGTHVDDLTQEEAYRVVELACTANDVLEVGQASSVPDAVAQVLVAEGGTNTLRHRIEDLAEDLDAAGSSGEFVDLLASFVVCEAVDAD